MKAEAKTIDDLLYNVLERLLRKPKSFKHSKGTAKEEIGALLVLKNPRARLSRSESRATLYSCLGETLWYLDGSSSLDRISYYISTYREKINVDESASDAPGAYGPRVFGGGADHQFERVAQILKNKNTRNTRKAVIQIYDKSDLLVYLNPDEQGNDVPCTVSLQFFLQSNRLHLMVHMRSNDAFVGLPHDVFAFTFMQEIMARRVGVRLGRYIQSVGSLHLYDNDENGAHDYLAEGFLDHVPMPTMPSRDPQFGLNWLLEQEHALRAGEVRLADEDSIEPYWRDLGRILLLKRLEKNHDPTTFSNVANKIEFDFFQTFVNDRHAQVSAEHSSQLNFPIPNTRGGESNE